MVNAGNGKLGATCVCEVVRCAFVKYVICVYVAIGWLSRWFWLHLLVKFVGWKLFILILRCGRSSQPPVPRFRLRYALWFGTTTAMAHAAVQRFA